MEAQLLAELVDFGALGLFSGFLIWLNMRTQKRLDEMNDRFQDTIQKQEVAHHAAEELIRTRYDAILGQYNSERNDIYRDVVKSIDEIKVAIIKPAV